MLFQINNVKDVASNIGSVKEFSQNGLQTLV